MLNGMHCVNCHRDPVPGRRQGGFTLVELMIVAAIIALAAGFTIPQLQRSALRARMLDAVREIERSVTVARTRAIKEGQLVVVDFPGNPWGSHGGVVRTFVDADASESYSVGEQIVSTFNLPPQLTLNLDTSDAQYTLYQLGARLGAATGTRGVVFLSNGTGVTSGTNVVGAGEGMILLEDLRQNQLRVGILGGTGTTRIRMWNPRLSRWDDNLAFWRY